MEGLGREALEDAPGDELVGVALRLGEDDGLAEDLLLHGTGAGSLRGDGVATAECL